MWNEGRKEATAKKKKLIWFIYKQVTGNIRLKKMKCNNNSSQDCTG